MHYWCVFVWWLLSHCSKLSWCKCRTLYWLFGTFLLFAAGERANLPRLRLGQYVGSENNRRYFLGRIQSGFVVEGLKKLPDDMYKGLFPLGTRLPEFYGLLKIHKENAPLRPVVAVFDGPLAPISIFLERILHQLLNFVPAHTENSAAATRSLEKSLSKADRQHKHVI